MKLAPIPYDESQRILGVQSLAMLDSEPEERFDRITRVAQLVFNIPYVFITLVDKDRVWFKSRQGCDLEEEPRDLSFCGHTICNVVTDKTNSRIFEVKDATRDPRFHDNPFVVGPSSNQFYIGFVLQSLDKRNVGTFCMVDTRRRHLTNVEKQIFAELGLIAELELNKSEHSLNSDMEINSLLKLLPECNDFKNCAEYFLKTSDAVNEMIKDMDRFLKRRRISYKEWRVLNEISQSESSTLKSVSINTWISLTSVSHLLQSLAAKRLIEKRNIEKNDSRKVHLFCTEAGRDMWLYGISCANKLGEKIIRADVLLNTGGKQKDTH